MGFHDPLETLTVLYQHLIRAQDELENSLYGNLESEKRSCSIVILEDLTSLTEECEEHFLCDSLCQSTSSLESRADTVLEEVRRLLAHKRVENFDYDPCSTVSGSLR